MIIYTAPQAATLAEAKRYENYYNMYKKTVKRVIKLMDKYMIKEGRAYIVYSARENTRLEVDIMRQIAAEYEELNYRTEVKCNNTADGPRWKLFIGNVASGIGEEE